MILCSKKGGGSTSPRPCTSSSAFFRSAKARLQRGQEARCPVDAFFLFRGEEILQIGRKPIFDLVARHFRSPNTRSRPSFRAFLARKSRDLTVPSGSFSMTPISS